MARNPEKPDEADEPKKPAKPAKKSAGPGRPPKKGKKPPGYDINAAAKKRNWLIQGGLTAVVVLFAVGLVLFIVMNRAEKYDGPTKPIRVASEKLIKKDGSDEPKVTLALYEDFLCPACGAFEQEYGPTISKLIDSGAVAVDYYMVAILDSPANQNYSSRAGNVGYCVADESIESFRRFHAAMYTPGIQPAETGPTFPNDARLIELARQAGAAGTVPECVAGNKYTDLVVNQSGEVAGVGTPMIEINGERYERSTPEALVAKVKETVGNVPGIDAPAPAAPAPTPPPGPGAPPVAPPPAAVPRQ